MGWTGDKGDKAGFMERFNKLAFKPKDNNTKIEYLKLNDDILEKIKPLTKDDLIKDRAILQLTINKEKWVVNRQKNYWTGDLS